MLSVVPGDGSAAPREDTMGDRRRLGGGGASSAEETDASFRLRSCCCFCTAGKRGASTFIANGGSGRPALLAIYIKLHIERRAIARPHTTFQHGGAFACAAGTRVTHSEGRLGWSDGTGA